ncbi:MAG: hypothetical protein ACREK5_01540 [Gemmatimonadota bacterium]
MTEDQILDDFPQLTPRGHPRLSRLRCGPRTTFGECLRLLSPGDTG